MPEEDAKAVAEAEAPPEETPVVPEEKPSDDSAPSESKPEPEVEPKEEEEKKPKGKLQQRFDRMTARIHAAEERASYLEEQLRSRTMPEPKVEAKAKPKPEDFDLGDGTYNHPAYTEALVEWMADEKIKQFSADQEARERQSEAQKSQEEETRQFRAHEADFADTVKDYEEVTDAAIGTFQQMGTPACGAIGPALASSEVGPQILYYLGEHLEEARRIAALSPSRAVMEIGKIEAQLAASTEEEKGQETRTPAPVSQAPKPISPIRKSSAGVKLRPDDPADAQRMSVDEWRRARDEQEKQRIRAQRGR